MENQENINVTPKNEEVVEVAPVVEATPETEAAPAVEETPAAEESPYGQDFASYNSQKPADKKDFFKNYASESFKKNIKIGAIISYVMIGINVVLVLLGNIFGIFDIVLQLGLTLGIHLKKSKGCAIALVVYGVINTIIASISAGGLYGWGWLAVAIYILVTFNKAEKEYKEVYGA